MAVIFDGKALCQRVKDDVKAKVAEFSAASGRKIKLAVVLVGENPASRVYVKNKIKAAEYVGIESLSFNLPETTQEAEVAELVKSLAKDDGVDAVLVQLPLPEHINEQRILDLIPPEKDVDGFSDINVGKLTLGKPCIAACTPSGIIEILKSAGIRNYSIWLDGNTLFGYYECEKGVEYAAKIQSESDVVKKWNEFMKDVMYMPIDKETGAQPHLTLVFEFN